MTIDLESRVSFSVNELAQLAGVDRRRFRRMLLAGGVQITRCGRGYLVYRAELRDSMPKLYEGLLCKVAPRED